MAKVSTPKKAKKLKGTSWEWDTGRRLSNIRKPKQKYPGCKFPDCFHCIFSDCRSD